MALPVFGNANLPTAAPARLRQGKMPIKKILACMLRVPIQQGPRVLPNLLEPCLTLLQLQCFSGEKTECFEILFLRATDNIFRKTWSGRLLVPANAFQVIANELLIEGW